MRIGGRERERGREKEENVGGVYTFAVCVYVYLLFFSPEPGLAKPIECYYILGLLLLYLVLWEIERVRE